MNRRQHLSFLVGLGASAGAFTASRRPAFAQGSGARPFTLPPLGYPYEALEPHIDTATMRVHHTGHHDAYVKALNVVAERYPDLARRPAVAVLAELASVPEAERAGVRNNLGGHWNHTHFWELMRPGGAREPGGDLRPAIDSAFGSVQGLMDQVAEKALGRFGSGWAWLAVDADSKLTILSTANQDNPHMDGARGVVLGVDVWEHAYYLKHQSRRVDYLNAWWNTVNWDVASDNFRMALDKR